MGGKWKGKKKINKDIDAEGWCFVCKDGGDLRICDYRQCLKSYHPECVGEDDSFLESDKKWNCAWHKCFHCRKSSYTHCYMCTNAVCLNCLLAAEFLPVRGTYGFCKSCLKLALLFEENIDCNSNEGMGDFADREMQNNLLQWYYVFIKNKEGFELADIYAAKERLAVSGSEDFDEEKEEEEQVSENEEFENEKTKWQKKRKRSSGRKPMSSNDKEFTGCTSKNFASFVVKNMKLVYLKRSVLKEMLKEPEVFEEKVTGCFVRVRSDPYDPQSRNSHQIMQVKGAKTVSTDENKTETVLLLSNMPTAEICISLISDEDFSEEEFEDLRKKVVAGEIQKPTVEDLQQKAKSLHKDMTNDMIRKELGFLKKEWQDALYWYMNRKKKLQSPTELERMLKNIPTVIPDDCEPATDPDSGGGKSDECSPKSTPLSQNALAMIPYAMEHSTDSNANNDGKSDEGLPESTTLSDSLPSDELLNENENEKEKEKEPAVVITMEEDDTKHGLVFEKLASTKPQQGRVIEVIEISDEEGEGEASTAAVEGNPEEEVWCVKGSNGEIEKFKLRFLRSWCKSCPYVPNFTVWREDGREENAIPLPEACFGRAGK